MSDQSTLGRYGLSYTTHSVPEPRLLCRAIRLLERLSGGDVYMFNHSDGRKTLRAHVAADTNVLKIFDLLTNRWRTLSIILFDPYLNNGDRVHVTRCPECNAFALRSDTTVFWHVGTGEYDSSGWEEIEAIMLTGWYIRCSRCDFYDGEGLN